MKIENILLDGEEIIYTLKSQKKSKLVGVRFMLGLCLIALISIVLIGYCELKHINYDNYKYIWAILIVLYMTFMENKIKRKKERYYITNKRIIKMYLNNIEEMQICFLKDAKILNEKKNIGDIIFSNTTLDGYIKSSSSIVEEVLEKRTKGEIIRFVGVNNPKEILTKVLSLQSMYR